MGRVLVSPSAAVALATVVALLGPSPCPADEQELPGALEEVAALDICPGNLAVTTKGRIFATVHQFRRGTAQLIEVLPPNGWRPWPNKDWNGAFGSGPNVLNSPLGVRVDRKDRLWVLDNGLGDPPQPPKLVAFSLSDGSVVFRYDFPPDTGPAGSFLNDLAVDDARGFVYIADIGGAGAPALVTVDLAKGHSRRFEASPALKSEDLDIKVEGRVISRKGPDGETHPARVGLNPITLSADGETLFFGPMSGRSWYKVPARLLREGAPDEQVAAAIERVGPKPICDGAATDAQGNHYFTDLANDAISVLHPDGRLETLVQDNDLLLWPDALSFGEHGWLYIAVNQLNRSPPLNGGVEAGVPPYRILRVYTGTDAYPETKSP